MIHLANIWRCSVCKVPGAVSIWRCYLTRIGIPIIKSRQYCNHLIYIWESLYLVRWYFYSNGAQESIARISSDIPLPHHLTFNISSPWTKLLAFHRWHFQMYFCPYFDLNFTEVCQYWFSNLIGCSTACSHLHQRIYQRYAIPTIREGHPPVTGSPHKGPVMQKVCSCHDVIMILAML